MTTSMRNWLLAGLVGLLVACSGGGGGDSAPGVEPGPPPPGGPVEPPPPEFPEFTGSPYAEAEELVATITSVSLDGNNQAIVTFQLTDGNNVAITDLEQGNLRFVISKLAASPLGGLTGTWQSYVNQIESPEVGIGTEPRLQATYERDGEFVNNGDGTYRYTYLTSLTDLPQDILDQAAAEGLDLTYEADRTHRVAIQFDGAPATANPFWDWVPATGAAGGVFNLDIASTDNCNSCHDPLNFHGGNRREMQYCVTCHNPGTTDADSTNTVDMKVMTHKIHMGRNLPSVQDGGEYVIYGFRNSRNDYSDLLYPQDIRNCVNCHVGTGTVGDRTDLTVTAQGDNWAEVPSRAACGSCHEDVVWEEHKGGQQDDSRCSQCHNANNVIDSHRMLAREARGLFLAEILGVSDTMPGENPVVSFKVSNPQTGEPYDIQSDPEFTAEDSRLFVGIAWDTTDYNNTGNGGNNASQAQANALTDATPNGDGSFSITIPTAIPDGSLPPGVAATGSGLAAVEGHPVVEIDGKPEEIPVGDASAFFSIDEADGVPVKRRYADDQADVLANCNSCHSTLVLHGNNRADNLETCASCHNPRNTDRRVREQGKNPDSGGSAMATDGKDEESIDFKTMVHGIHAAAIRENPLQIVGFMAFGLHVYDEEHVHYPGNLANCAACHVDNSFALPLADGVLATTIHTGDDIADPADDTVITPESAVCASCHDDATAQAHMESQGGNFATTQAAIDAGEVVETCSVCHGEGRANDAWVSHQGFLD